MLQDELVLAEAPVVTACADTAAAAPARSGPLRRMAALPRHGRRNRAVFANRLAREQFLDLLTRAGDPAVAADALGLSLVQLFRLRDADPSFAAEWQAAVGYAWERVESRVLAELLARVEPPADGAVGRKAAGSLSGLLDSRLALAVLARREKPVTRLHGKPVESASVARLRAELRELAGLATRRG